MLHPEIDIQTQVNLAKNIQYLNFKKAKSICFINFLLELLNDPKNANYKESIEFLYQFADFNPLSFKQKYYNNVEIPSKIIDVFSEILDKLPKGSFKAKIASIILIKDRFNKNEKLKLAKVVVENFEYDFSKIFKQSNIDEYNIYFTIDLAYKFKFKTTFTKLKNIFKIYLNNNIENIDFKFISLYEYVIQHCDIWNEKEHITTMKKLYQSSMNRKNKLFAQELSQCSQNEKNIICNILNLIICVIEKSFATNKYRYIKDKLYQEIIDINLKFAEQITDNGMSFEALQYAKIIVDRKNDKKLMKDINRRIQILNQKIIQQQKEIYISFNEKQQECIKHYEMALDILFNTNDNLFQSFSRIESLCKINEIVNFESLAKSGGVFRLIATRIEFKENGSINNIRTGIDDIFEEYRSCVEWCGIFYGMLKAKLLQKFYPQKEYFYLLVCNNNIIPKGYEEIIARMLYAGIHNDNMDFFIYLAVSIESILRNIIERNNGNTIKNNKHNLMIQENETLETMIKEIKDKKYIDEKDIKEIELLFCRNGFNIRNEIAHSNFTEKDFSMRILLCNYLWGFMMRFFIKYYSYMSVESKSNQHPKSQK